MAGGGAPVIGAHRQAQQTLGQPCTSKAVQGCPLALKELVTPSITGVPKLIRHRLDKTKSQVGKIHLKADRKLDNLGYAAIGKGLITPAPGVDLFLDAGCASKVSSPLSYPVVQLIGGVDLWIRPDTTKATSASFTLLLSRPTDPRTTVEGPATYTVKIEDIILVAPVIKAEYKVAMLDQNLAHFQKAGEPKLTPDPTRVELSLSDLDPRYTGKGTLDLGGKVKAFLEPTCSRELKNLDFTADQLRGTVKLWLKGMTAGTFDLKLTLSPSTNPMVEVGPPAKETMGVAALVMHLYQYDDSATKPAKRPWDNAGLTQVVLNDGDKVAGQRLLSVSKAGNAARCKVVIDQLVAGQWPVGSDQHQVVVASFFRFPSHTGANKLKVFDAETGGHELTLPWKLDVPALKAAPKTVWVEGAVHGDNWADVGLDLGLDRADQGPITKVVKRLGDFGRFTVVQVLSADLKPNDRVKDDGAVSGHKKYTVWTNLTAGQPGREIEANIKIAPPLSGVKLYVRLVGDVQNRKTNNGVNIAEVWPRIDHSWTKSVELEAFDTPARGDPKHRNVVTNNGAGACKVDVSRYAGDIARVGVYLTQDPQQGQFEAGDATHKLEPPLFNQVRSRRVFWIQLIQAQGSPALSLAKATANFDVVQAGLVTKPELSLTPVDMAAIPNSRYPGYMILENAGNGLLTMISNLNKDKFYTKYQPANLTLPVAIGDSQWDLTGASKNSNTVVNGLKATDFPATALTSYCLCDPALDGTPMFISGWYKTYDLDAATNTWSLSANGNLTADQVTIDPNRDDVQKVTLLDPTLVDGVSQLGATSVVNISVTLKGGAGPYAGESANQRIITIRQADQQFNDTITHECGHAFRQVIHPANQLPGTPAHPNSKQGQGWHCFYHEAGEPKKCVMDPVVQLDPTGIHRFCEVCRGFLVVEEMSQLQ